MQKRFNVLKREDTKWKVAISSPPGSTFDLHAMSILTSEILIIRTKCFIISLWSTPTVFSHCLVSCITGDNVFLQSLRPVLSVSQQQETVPGLERAAAPRCSGGWSRTERRETPASEHQRWSSDTKTESSFRKPHCQCCSYCRSRKTSLFSICVWFPEYLLFYFRETECLLADLFN